MPVRSAGILLWRRRRGDVEVLIAHMGGPLWTGKDAAAWSFPKGLCADGEELVAAAVREWNEELGLPLPVAVADLVPLGEARQGSGKLVSIWAAEGDLDPGDVVPGTFTMTWPPRSGTVREFPEVDGVDWCTIDAARPRLVAGQRTFLDRLLERLG